LADSGDLNSDSAKSWVQVRADPPCEVRAVAERAARDHRVRPPLGRAVEQQRGPQRRQIAARALLVDQADDRGAQHLDGGAGEA
jgi:hypothetical protein